MSNPNPERDERDKRLNEIRENRRNFYSGMGQLTADIDYLLSLFDSQATGDAGGSCPFCDSGLVFNEREVAALSDLYERTGLRTAKILKHALALYQLHIVKGLDLPLESKLPPDTPNG